MGVISVTPGAVFQFIDANKGVLQYAGTEDAFNRIIKNELTISQSAIATVRPSATLTIDGTLTNSGIIKTEYLRQNAVTAATSSITNLSELAESGSFISAHNGDHMLLLGTTNLLQHVEIKYIKSSNSSNLVTVRSSVANRINGQTQWSSSDAYASIQLVFTAATPVSNWIITSKVGNWY